MSVEIGSVVLHEEVPKEEDTVKTVRGLASSHRALLTAAEMDLAQWWILEEVGHHLQRMTLCAGVAQCKERGHT
jgi:hypothetical protein